MSTLFIHNTVLRQKAETGRQQLTIQIPRSEEKDTTERKGDKKEKRDIFSRQT